MTSIENNWPFQKLVPAEDTALYDILRTYEIQLDRIDVELDDLRQQRFIDTATGEELEKLAAEVGVVKQVGESEESLRFRAKIAKATSRSDGKIDDLATLFYLFFGEDAEKVSISSASDYPVITVELPAKFLDDIPITQSELENELLAALPAGDGLEILSKDDFAFAGENSGKGFDEGEWI